MGGLTQNFNGAILIGGGGGGVKKDVSASFKGAKPVIDPTGGQLPSVIDAAFVTVEGVINAVRADLTAAGGKLGHETFKSPAASSTDALFPATPFINAPGSQNISFSGQPDCPRTLLVEVVGPGVTGYVYIAGTDAAGDAVSCSIEITGSGTNETPVAFATVSTFQLNGVTGAVVPTSTISCGFGNVFGLCVPVVPTGYSFTVYKVCRAGVDVTSAIGNTWANARIIALQPSAAPNGSADYDFWWKVTPPAPSGGK